MPCGLSRLWQAFMLVAGLQVAMNADVTCGLSLGEYTALTFADAMRYVSVMAAELLHASRCGLTQLHPPCSFEDGLKLVKLRGESMQAAADAKPSGMVSVIGLSSDKVRPKFLMQIGGPILCTVIKHYGLAKTLNP